MPKSSAILPRRVVKNGKEQWCVTTPRDLAGDNPKRKFFAVESEARDWASRLTSSRGTFAAIFQRLSVPDQETVARLISRVDGDVSELVRLVDLGERHSRCNSVSVEHAVAEFIAHKRKDGVQAHMMRNYVATIEKQFGAAFGGSVNEIRSRDVDDWLRGLPEIEPTTRNKKRGFVLTFFEWLKAREYLPHDAFWNLTTAIEPQREIEILTPAEMRRLLKAACAERSKWKNSRTTLVPFVCLGGFAGLRTSEICRLDWADISFERLTIHVRKPKRTRSSHPRVVPLLPNLAAWLQLYARNAGQIILHKRISEALLRICGQAGIEWKKNALRHSYTSYRVATTQNEHQTATEIGDLVSTMKRHYKQAVDPGIAAEWFNIAPVG